jgi:DNA helicase-2/ATP-dependent DNA helicase PcrA
MSSSARSKLPPFRALVRSLRGQIAELPGAADALELVLRATGYEDRLRLEGEEGEDRIENLHELVGAAREFDRAWREARAEQPAARAAAIAPGALGSPQGPASPAAHVPGDRPDPTAAFAAAALEDEDEAPSTPLVGFLEQLALVGDADAEGGGDRVSLMTLHAAKGLEFDAVWMTGMEERVFPNSRSLGMTAGGTGEEDEHEIAEERRLCYVGMTRARQRLTLTLARCRTLFGDLRFNPPSRFLRELPPALCEGLGALDARAQRPAWARDEGFRPSAPAPRGERIEYDADQRPSSWDDGPPRSRPPPLRPFSRNDPLSRPEVKQAPAGMAGLGRGARVRHKSFGVGTVEGSDGLGAELKLTVRFPSVGVKKVLARFLEPA